MDDRPNIAHYHRLSPRHAWRRGGTTVNADPASLPKLQWYPGDPNLYADIPYDVGVWYPPRMARTLPGITRTLIDSISRS